MSDRFQCARRQWKRGWGNWQIRCDCARRWGGGPDVCGGRGPEQPAGSAAGADAQPGRKILISGGGRCNFTNIHCTPANFISENPHFAKSALALYEPRHFLELVERYGIRVARKDTRDSCSVTTRRGRSWICCLRSASAGDVEILLNARGIAVEGGSGGFRVECSAGAFAAGALVVATGGLSIPKMGATGLVYELARQFGLKVVEPRPALVPLVLGGQETELDGTGGGCGGRDGAGRSGGPQFQRKAAGDASRIERAGGAAGVVVLAVRARRFDGGFRAGNADWRTA